MKIKSILAAALLVFSVSAVGSTGFRMLFGPDGSSADVTAENPLPSAGYVNGAPVSSINPIPSLIYGTQAGSTNIGPLSYDVLNNHNSLSVGLGGVYYGGPSTVNSVIFSPLIAMGNTQGTYQQATIAPAATVATLTPPANKALAGWAISITSNATLAVAGTDTITVALNGVTLYQTSVYIPATALATAGQMYAHKQKYNSFVVPKVGSAGTFTVTLGTALATGTVNVNEYSGN